MDYKKRGIVILAICISLTALFSAYILYKTFRPSHGVPYEIVTMEQAAEYMDYESGYALIDVRDTEAFNQGHIRGAVSIPISELKESCASKLNNLNQMIYVYSDSEKSAEDAAQILCDLGYTNITEIGDFADWTGSVEIQQNVG